MLFSRAGPRGAAAADVDDCLETLSSGPGICKRARPRALTSRCARTTLSAMRFADQCATVNGLALHYVEWGAPSAPPVVLLHGITGHATTWDHLAGVLADRHRVIALDQRGHGDSAPAPDGDYGVAAMAGDLAAFVDRLGLGSFALVALSMGGRVAMAYAGGGHVERVSRLVLVDIGPDINPAGLDPVPRL